MRIKTFRASTASVFFLLAIAAFVSNERDVGWYCLIISSIWSCSLTLKSIED